MVNNTPRPLYPRKATRYPLYRRLGGSQGRAGLVLKFSPPPGYVPRTIQPVTSRCQHYATPAHIAGNAIEYLHDITEYIFRDHMALTLHLLSLNDYGLSSTYFFVNKSIQRTVTICACIQWRYFCSHPEPHASSPHHNVLFFLRDK